MEEKSYFVYIASNKTNKVLYTGITNDLVRRMYEHKNKLVDGFTKKYNVNRLLFCEEFFDPSEAIAAEKRIKGWLRNRKLELIRKNNPEFKDLSTNF